MSGTAEIGATLTVNGAAVTVDASGGWTTSVTPAGDGPLAVTAVATDAAGNSATDTRDLTVDTVAPAVAITTIEGGDDLIDAAEAAGGITVSGTAEIGSTLTVNGAAVTVDASGGWTTSVTPAGDGPLTVTAVATDAAGNSATATHQLTVDTVPPAVAITTIEGGDDLINAAEAAGGIDGVRDGGDRRDADGERRGGDGRRQRRLDHLVVTPAGDGPLTVTAVATDAAGNTATDTRDLTVDTVAPAAPVITSIAENDEGGINAGEAADGTPVVVGLTGTGAAAGDTLTINWGGQAVTHLLVAGDITASSVTVTVPATTITAQGDGTFDVTATLTDAAGNPGANSAAFPVTVDTVAPVAPVITSIAENGGGGINASEAADGTPVVVDLTGTGAVAGDTLTLIWGGQAVTYLLVAGDITASSVTVTVPATTITAQGDGTFDVTATLTDAAGNASANSAAHLGNGRHGASGGGDHHDRGWRRPDQRRRGGGRDHGVRDGGDRRDADGERRGGDGRRQRRLDHLGGDAGGRRPADGDGGGHRRGRQQRDGDACADGRHGAAGGGDHHDRGRRRPDRRRRGGGRDHGVRDGGDRRDADGERRGGDGRRQRRLDHLGDAGGATAR